MIKLRVFEEEDLSKHCIPLGKVAFDITKMRSFLGNLHFEHWVSKH